jgi:hypothetical protein
MVPKIGKRCATERSRWRGGRCAWVGPDRTGRPVSVSDFLKALEGACLG